MSFPNLACSPVPKPDMPASVRRLMECEERSAEVANARGGPEIEPDGDARQGQGYGGWRAHEEQAAASTGRRLAEIDTRLTGRLCSATQAADIEALTALVSSWS